MEDQQIKKDGKDSHSSGLFTLLAKLHNYFSRPSRKLYQGKPNIILGVAMVLDKPATVAIVEGVEENAIAFRSIKQLLGTMSIAKLNVVLTNYMTIFKKVCNSFCACIIACVLLI